MRKSCQKFRMFLRKTETSIVRGINSFIKDERGETNLIAILLIIVVTVALVAVFKDNILDLIEDIFKKIGKEVDRL